jgi:hypothetical protein
MHTPTARALIPSCIIVALTLHIATTASAQIPTIARTVQCGGPAARIDHELIRGETACLEYRYEQTGATFSVQSATNVALRFRSADMTNSFYSLGGTVTGNIARFTWSPAYQVAATTLAYTVYLGGAVGANLRAFGTIKQLGSVEGAASNGPTLYAPIPWSTAIAILNTALTVSATATNVHFADLLDVPPVWPGTATDSTARAVANAASQATSNTQNTVASITGGLVRVTGSYLAATCPNAYLTSNNHVLATLYLTNGYASSTHSSPGTGGVLSPELSADSNTWSTATVTGSPCYWRLRTSLYLENTAISNIAVYSWQRPTLIGTSNDFQGQTIYADTPTSARSVANKTYVDDATGAISPANWADYPAVANVRLAGKRLTWDTYTISSNGALAAVSYAIATSQQWFRIQHSGHDLFRISASNNFLAITNWSVTSSNITLCVATNDLQSSPWPEVTSNLIEGVWAQISPFTTATNGDLSVTLAFSNAWTSAPIAYFRAVCSATNPTLTALLTDQTTARELIPESVTLGGEKRTTWPVGGISASTATGIAESVVGSVVPTSSVAHAATAGTATDPTARTASSNATAAASAASEAATNAQNTANSATSNAATAQATADLAGPYLASVIRLAATNPVITVNAVSNYFRWAPTNSGPCNVSITPLGTNIATVGVLHGWLQHTNTVSWATNILFNLTGTHTNAAPSLPQDWRFTIELSEGQVCLHLAPTNGIAHP